ncbi:deoxyhypusine hydroxylase [Hydra vulgaris]|uniref:Deoxyhypusine hydroxylase n=1 Tax=Hydra vulgaris TaxID=6087 RepID=T2M6J0_HYDVU|nr:deoxyhypusine hydroxylase [Hydra vulgaris]
MSLQIDNNTIFKIGESLRDVNKPLKDRFRNLFTLKNINNEQAISEIAKSFKDSSALFKHELAYCLGQMKNALAIPILTEVLSDESQEAIVRHEAAEAIGAIGLFTSLPLLETYRDHKIVEIAETCDIAIDRIKWLQTQQSEPSNSYHSVDPAPPMEIKSTSELADILLNEKKKLFERYSAMFSLRDKGGDSEVLALCKGLKCKSALFRHEIAFVLGQMAHPLSIDSLKETLENKQEHGMVRHECAEALGAIATSECFEILNKYLQDDERVVRESCDIALDMYDYENSDQFQYADGLSKHV